MIRPDLEGGPVAVLGGGSWGSTLAHLAAQSAGASTLWLRDEEVASEVNEQRTNRRYLGETPVAPGLTATTDLERAVRGRPLVIVALPSSCFRSMAGVIGEFLTGDQVVLSATKGLEPESFARMSEVLRSETCARKVGALSGPNLAKEILAGQPSATVVASRFKEVIVRSAEALHSPGLRIYGNPDLKGVELAGALKNVIAIASGVAQGLGFGANVRAMIVTRGLAEIQRLGVKLGADPLTFSGLAGIGDLLVTCSSELSRNFRVGLGLAQEQPLAQILEALGETAEGVNTTRVALALSQHHGVAMPITEGLHGMLFGERSPREVLEDLMTRRARYEIDFDYSAEV